MKRRFEKGIICKSGNIENYMKRDFTKETNSALNTVKIQYIPLKNLHTPGIGLKLHSRTIIFNFKPVQMSFNPVKEQ